jgi:hypothetical protein
MERVTLQFQTPQDLSNFRKAACDIKEVNIRDLTMICECTDTEIARAMNYYGAVVIKEHGEGNG